MPILTASRLINTFKPTSNMHKLHITLELIEASIIHARKSGLNDVLVKHTFNGSDSSQECIDILKKAGYDVTIMEQTFVANSTNSTMVNVVMIVSWVSAVVRQQQGIVQNIYRTLNSQETEYISMTIDINEYIDKYQNELAAVIDLVSGTETNQIINLFELLGGTSNFNFNSKFINAFVGLMDRIVYTPYVYEAVIGMADRMDNSFGWAVLSIIPPPSADYEPGWIYSFYKQIYNGLKIFSPMAETDNIIKELMEQIHSEKQST